MIYCHCNGAGHFGWTLDRISGLWVHADPACLLPSRATLEHQLEELI